MIAWKGGGESSVIRGGHMDRWKRWGPTMHDSIGRLLNTRARVAATIMLVVLSAVVWTAGCEKSRPNDSDSVANVAEADGASVEACLKKLEATRPNIILVTICTGRFWNMGIGGYDRDTTPFIDALAKRGVLFSDAVSSSSWTKPTTASILTGMTPNVHGMTDYYEYGDIRRQGFAPKRVLADEIITIAECLGEAGYKTFCRNNNIHASHFFNMTQGFDDAPPIYGNYETPMMLADLEAFLDKTDADTPFFAFMLTRDAHVPYMPEYKFYRKFCRSKQPVPPSELRQHCASMKVRLNQMSKNRLPFSQQQKRDYIDLYDAELNQLDMALSTIPSLLQKTKRDGNTVIIITADHGERFFGAHGPLGHAGGFMGEALTHIPLVFFGSGIPDNRVIDKQVRSIDLYPTLAALAGATSPPVVQGRSLLPLICGDTSQPELSAFTSYREQDHAVRMDGYKLHLFADGHTELYDIKDDPHELKELSQSHPEQGDKLADELKRWMDLEAKLSEQVARGEMRELSPEALEALRDLGYIE